MSQQQAKADPVSLEELLTHAAWARRLARGLVCNDSATAEDTVQDVFLAAVQAPPARGGALRGWLRKVLTHERASRLLSDRRREARELAAPALARAESPSPEELTATVEVQRLLAGFVLALPEPFRQTLVLRYYDDRSSAEIARLLSVPAGTVRWRLKEGLSRLRARLDQERGGSEAWRAVLAPIAAASRSKPAGGVGPAAQLARLAARTGLWAGVGALAVGAAAVGLWTLPAGAPGHPGVEQAAAPGPGAGGSWPASTRAPGLRRAITAQGRADQEGDLRTVRLKRVAAFVGVGLPAMVASARQGAVPPPVQEVVGLCMTAQEKSFECKQEVVAAWLALRDPPEKYREAMRKKMLEEITTWGSGPVAPRREKCEQLAVGSGGTRSQAALDKDKEVMATMRACFARADCATRADCIGQLMTTGALPEVGLSSKAKAKP